MRFRKIDFTAEMYGNEESCMEGKQCVGLGLQIVQLKENIKML